MIALLLPALLGALLSTTSGCGRREMSPTEAERLRSSIAAETGDAETLLRIEGGDIHIRSGGQHFSVNPTETRERPRNLPVDVGRPADARFDLWAESDRGQTLSLRSELAPDPLLEFLRREWTAQAWRETSDVRADSLRSLAFRKANRQIALTLEPDPERPEMSRALLFIEPVPAE